MPDQSGVTANATPAAGVSSRSRLRAFWSQLSSDPRNRRLGVIGALFLVAYFVPWSSPRIATAVHEAFLMAGYYAREHVLLCLVPAFFIAGAITVFLNQQAIIRYLGPNAPKLLAYGVASVSGSILAVCSCTVLPLFKGIYRKGAGLGPAIGFLYSGPAINVLAVVLTAKVLGLQLGVARAVGAVLFAIVIGILMQLLFLKEDTERTTNAAMFEAQEEESSRSLPQTAVHMASMIGILLFLNWASSGGEIGWWDLLYRWRLPLTGGFSLLLLYSLLRWFRRSELRQWVVATRDFAVQILPLLFAGVMIAGFLLGRPGQAALIPEAWIGALVGTNSAGSNMIAAASGALMYFATLTEVPIMQGLLGAGMHRGPALALLLAGPSLSLPSLLVIAGELGARKTLVYVVLVVLLSTAAGMAFGALVAG